MGAVLVWDARTGIVHHNLRSGDTSQVNCLVFSHDGKYLLVGMGGTRVMRWHLESTVVIALPKLLTVDGWANVPSL
jgi:WD40 repeat protein